MPKTPDSVRQCSWQWPPGNFPGPWNVCVIPDSKNRSTQKWHQSLRYKLHVHFNFNQPLLCFLLSPSLRLAGRKRSVLEHMHIFFIVQTGKNRSRNNLPASCCHQPLPTGRSTAEQQRLEGVWRVSWHSQYVSRSPLKPFLTHFF